MFVVMVSPRPTRRSWLCDRAHWSIEAALFEATEDLSTTNFLIGEIVIQLFAADLVAILEYNSRYSRTILSGR